MSKRNFKIIIEQDEDGYFVGSAPALPGCHTQAKSLGELKERMREAIGLCLEVASEDPTYREKVKDHFSEPVFVGLDTVEV